MKSAPSSLAFCQKMPNLISLLQSTSGFGVRPALYSSSILSTTACLYSFSKSKKRNGIFKERQTFIASRLSSLHVQAIHSGCQAFMNTPVTEYPCSLSKAALTAESTPPDNPTKTLAEIFLFVNDVFIMSPGIISFAILACQEIEIGSRSGVKGSLDRY